MLYAMLCCVCVCCALCAVNCALRIVMYGMRCCICAVCHTLLGCLSCHMFHSMHVVLCVCVYFSAFDVLYVLQVVCCAAFVYVTVLCPL